MSTELSIRDIRLQKLAQMRELGHDPFSIEKWDRTDTAEGLLEGFEDGKDVSFAGRVVSYRLMGKAGFAHLSDGDARIQIYVRKDEVTELEWSLYDLIDIGDHVGVKGKLFVTKTGEKSIHATEFLPLTKALEPLPLGKEKDGQVFSGLSDVETRYRHRHLDLLANRESRAVLINRAKVVSAVRRYFDSNGYLEVETPLLQLEAGGAAARPFKTHYNAYEMDVKLRISLELYLKRLICGDLPAVYEIGRVFRNEGVSNRHNPEFTMLEFYEAYGNLETMMMRVEECFKSVALAVYNTTTFALWAGVFRAMYPETFGNLIAGGQANPPVQNFSDIGNKVLLHGPFVDGRPRSLLIYVRELRVADDDENCQPITELEIVTSGLSFVPPLTGEIKRDHLTGCLIVPEGTEVKLGGDSHVFGSASYCRFAWIEQPTDNYSLIDYAMDPVTVDFGRPWRRVHLLEEIERHTGLSAEDLSTLENAKWALADKLVVNPITGKHIDPSEERNLGGLIEKLLEVFVEPTLQEPTFVVGYPIETSPLAKKDPANPKMTRRFEGYVLGREVCNAFSEINDPIDQRERFEQQLGEREKGDDEAHPMDEEFIYALECGMPPTGGCGIGLDRMAMLLTGSHHIREVLLFPFMRPTVESSAE